MPCGSCGGGSASANYPKKVKMPDGTVIEVSSLAEERLERDKAYARQRQAEAARRRDAVAKGWTASQA